MFLADLLFIVQTDILTVVMKKLAKIVIVIFIMTHSLYSLVMKTVKNGDECCRVGVKKSLNFIMSFEDRD